MSMENVKKFMDLVRTEESLAKRMVALKDGLQEGEFAFKDDKEFVEKKILPLAKEYDLEFSVEDFMEFTSSQLTSLSEDELSEISGGFPGLSLLMGLSLFIGGGAMTTAAQKAVSYFTGGGTSTSTVQSVADKDVDMSGAAGAEEKSNKIAFDERFKAIKKEFSKSIKTAFDGVKSYMSPEDRSTWIESIATHHKQINSSEDKYVNSRYNKADDRIYFTATWNNMLIDHMDPDKYSQAVLKGKLSNILKQHYDEAYGNEATWLTQKYNTLKTQLQEKQNEKNGYEGKIKDLTQKNTELQSTVGYCYKQLIAVCDALIQNNSSNYQYKRWKAALEDKTFRAWDNLKEKAEKYFFTTENGQNYTYDTYVDTLESTTQQIEDNNSKISQLQYSAGQAQAEILSINNQMKNIYDRWQPYADKQKAFNDNMKTEFNYFFGALYDALKKDKEISDLAKGATTTGAKPNLANKIKEKADHIIKEKLQAQLLAGCNFEFVQTDLTFDIKVHYNNQGWHSTFSVDEFISTDNHLQIINSEANKKCDEVAKKLAEYIQRKFTDFKDTGLKRTIQSVLNDLKAGKLNDLNLGIQIVNSDDKQVTFSSSSGDQQLNTVLTIERIADEYNKMVNMQAMEATRKENEGTVEYTSFGRKWWNSIGRQAQHVLETLNQIENLSDVKDRETFENDLKYVANQIAEESRGNVKKMYLAGEHRNDYSFKMAYLQKIKDFADKIGQ